MGFMKRAAERERNRPSDPSRSYCVVLTWKRDGELWLVNFLHPRSRMPVSRQRIIRSASAITGMVERTLTKVSGGPQRAMFLASLERGAGELEVRLTAEQYIALLSPGSDISCG